MEHEKDCQMETYPSPLLHTSLVGLGHLKPITVYLKYKHTEFFLRILIEIVHSIAPYPKH